MCSKPDLLGGRFGGTLEPHSAMIARRRARKELKRRRMVIFGPVCVTICTSYATCPRAFPPTMQKPRTNTSRANSSALAISSASSPSRAGPPIPPLGCPVNTDNAGDVTPHASGERGESSEAPHGMNTSLNVRNPLTYACQFMNDKHKKIKYTSQWWHTCKINTFCNILRVHTSRLSHRV